MRNKNRKPYRNWSVIKENNDFEEMMLRMENDQELDSLWLENDKMKEKAIALQQELITTTADLQQMRSTYNYFDSSVFFHQKQKIQNLKNDIALTDYQLQIVAHKMDYIFEPLDEKKIKNDYGK